MDFHVMTLFPETVRAGLSESITKRAIDNGIIGLNTYDIRDFSKDKHRHVDDYTYGGGAGMLMAPDPVVTCYEHVRDIIVSKGGTDRPRVLLMTPVGRTFDQRMAEELSGEKDVVLLCGHYEGIDERAIELVVTDRVSIGDFVLTGGELPAMMIIDAVSRLVPGVLGSDESAFDESFTDGLLEYPQYTRPPEYRGLTVPEVLLSGHHQNISDWRFEQSIMRTKQIRPELYEAYVSSHEEELKKYMKRTKKRII